MQLCKKQAPALLAAIIIAAGGLGQCPRAGAQSVVREADQLGTYQNAGATLVTGGTFTPKNYCAAVGAIENHLSNPIDIGWSFHLGAVVLPVEGAALKLPNLLQNGSFEDPGNNTSDRYDLYPAGSPNLTGWTVLNNGVECFDPTSSYTATSGNNIGSSQDGDFMLDLAPPSSGGGISQTANTLPNHLYRLTFHVATTSIEGRSGTCSINIKIGGDNYTATATGGSTLNWIKYVIDFTATAYTTTIEFSNSEDQALHFANLDNVSLVAALELSGAQGGSYVLQPGSSVSIPDLMTYPDLHAEVQYSPWDILYIDATWCAIGANNDQVYDSEGGLWEVVPNSAEMDFVLFGGMIHGVPIEQELGFSYFAETPLFDGNTVYMKYALYDGLQLPGFDLLPEAPNPPLTGFLLSAPPIPGNCPCNPASDPSGGGSSGGGDGDPGDGDPGDDYEF